MNDDKARAAAKFLLPGCYLESYDTICNRAATPTKQDNKPVKQPKPKPAAEKVLKGKKKFRDKCRERAHRRAEHASSER